MTARGGRPAGPTRETSEAVLQAAFRLLVTEGPGELTAVRLHRETGVARTTVYRHWPTPGHLVTDILTQATARHELDDLTGELASDLRVAVATLTFRFDHRPVTALFRATLACDPTDDGRPMSEHYVDGLIAPVRDVLTAAVARGEIAGDPDALTTDLCGPLLLDHLLLGRPVDHAAIEARVDGFLDALT